MRSLLILSLQLFCSTLCVDFFHQQQSLGYTSDQFLACAYRRCRYVRDKDACGADDQYIPYLELFYCASGKLWLLVSVFLVVWLLLLFYAMSIVAEVFLCPAVQVS